MARKKSTSAKGTRRRASAKSTAGRRSARTRSRTTRTTRSKPTTRRPKLSLSFDLHQKALIAGIFFIVLTATIVLSLLSPNQGQLTAALSDFMWKLFGWGGLVIPGVMAAGGFYLVLWGMEQPPRLPTYRLLGFLLLFISAEAFASMAWVAWGNELEDVWAVAEAGTGGGYFGGLFVWVLTQGVGLLGTVFLLLVVGVVAAVLVSGVSRQDAGLFLTGLLARRPRPARDVPVSINRAGTVAALAPAAEGERAAPAMPGRSSRIRSAAQEADQPAQAATPAQPKSRTRRGRGASTERAAEPRQPAPEVEPAPIFLSQSSSQIWTLPELDRVLESGGEQDVSDAVIREQVEIIEHTLESFGAPATVVEISQGPTITQYGVEPSFIEQRSGKRTKVKVGKIASLADDLALALAARSIRIQAPVPGKGYVGIEVPNPSKALVSLRDVMESPDFQQINSPLRIGLGQNVAGQPIATDLAQMPHLLIAGTTGSGKSVCVNSIVACLLLQNSPDNLKIVMVDPKRVELTGYNGIPHLVAPVVVDLERVVGTLQWAMREMDNRYKRLAHIGARNIAEYNRKAADRGEEKMPYIVILIDELADLMMLSPEQTERGITRLAQMARATGIHMVIATQRPSVDVVTGLIKANFPARIAFAVASSTDSRVILDTTGAERLLGQGDMLFQSPDAAAPVRMQGCFVSERELQVLIEYWQGARRAGRVAESEAKAAQEEVEAEEARQQPLWEEMREVEEEAARYSDELLPEAVALVRHLNKASTSLLQRRFRIGYTRAARLMDTMEEDGIIGPPTGTSKARAVLPAATEPSQNGDPESQDTNPQES